jgi:hypothetical protein
LKENTVTPDPELNLTDEEFYEVAERGKLLLAEYAVDVPDDQAHNLVRLHAYMFAVAAPMVITNDQMRELWVAVWESLKAAWHLGQDYAGEDNEAATGTE